MTDELNMDAFNQLASPCADCERDTHAWHDQEMYMVVDALWEAYGAGEGFVCIGCLEARMGRELRAEDFQDVKLHQDERPRSERLSNRLSLESRDAETERAYLAELHRMGVQTSGGWRCLICHALEPVPTVCGRADCWAAKENES